jgi:DNA repair exonuclease SbcCD nuclease subunit
MARFKIFSDIHIHQWTAFARLNKKGVNTRLMEIIITLERIIHEAHEQNCDAILFSGDLWHVPKVDAVTMDLTLRVLRTSRIPIVLIPGNHDEADKLASFHTMRGLHGFGNCHLLDAREGRTVTIAGTKIGGVPFTGSRRRLVDSIAALRRCDLVLCHTGFAGATAGFDYIAKQKNFVQPHKLGLKETNIQLVIAGHFHQPQIMRPRHFYKSHLLTGEERFHYENGTVLVPGAPLHHNFGDVGSIRGSWLLDTERKSLRFNPGDYAAFVRPSFDPANPGRFAKRVKGNYASVKVDEALHLAQAQEILEEHSLGFILSLARNKTERGADRPRVRIGMPQGEILKRFIRHHDVGDFTRESLLKMGLNLLKEAESQ